MALQVLAMCTPTRMVPHHAGTLVVCALGRANGTKTVLFVMIVRHGSLISLSTSWENSSGVWTCDNGGLAQFSNSLFSSSSLLATPLSYFLTLVIQIMSFVNQWPYLLHCLLVDSETVAPQIRVVKRSQKKQRDGRDCSKPAIHKIKADSGRPMVTSGLQQDLSLCIRNN